jgi:RNA polymerase sigma factor (sigma-70 family)
MDLPGETRPMAAAEHAEAAQRLDEAFARHQGELMGMLVCVVGHAEDARDALQEAFIKCWRRLDDLGEIANLRAWIFQIALNAGRDMRATAWRRRRRPLGEGEAVLASPQPAADADAGRCEQLALVRRAVMQLRPEEQEVFLLRQNGDMTHDQIAEATGVPLGTVKTRMRLAIGKLRKALNP